LIKDEGVLNIMKVIGLDACYVWYALSCTIGVYIINEKGVRQEQKNAWHALRKTNGNTRELKCHYEYYWGINESIS